MARELEVERKWLVPAIPPAELDRAVGVGEAIDQGYLTIGDGGTETRIRRRAGEYVLTVKSGTGLARRERSVVLNRDQFEALWPVTAGRRVEKTRYLIPAPDAPELMIELDVYGGELDGLVVAEIEFESAPAATAFDPPAWFGPEVTDDHRYKNQALATGGRPD
jgi:CYTH domain-containing protein